MLTHRGEYSVNPRAKHREPDTDELDVELDKPHEALPLLTEPADNRPPIAHDENNHSNSHNYGQHHQINGPKSGNIRYRHRSSAHDPRAKPDQNTRNGCRCGDQ